MSEEYFYKNINRWAKLVPEQAEQLALLECKRVFATKTPQGKENLSIKTTDGDVLLHDEDPEEEAHQWFASLNLYQIQVLYVYGVGLGYYFEAALEWLKDPSHYLLFLEDDPEVLYRLFETERGYRLLQHKQVRVNLFDLNNPAEDIWNTITKTFNRYAFQVSGLKTYLARTPSDVLSSIHSRLEFWNHVQGSVLGEYANYGEHYFFNFYQNLFLLPDAYLAGGLYGKFSGIPAIICGAGPSLDKNLDTLEELKNRAIIFAGGTAMNAVNSRGFLPDFGVGIDPNEPQSTRLIMNTAYEVPFFYRSRIYRSALELVHANKLYVTGSGSYRLPSYFEEKLGIPSADVDEGLNVVNFSISLASALGCSPIILVGVDLAYTDLKSYQSGVKSHPIHHRGHDFKTKGAQEELLMQNDIYGQPVHTLWKWVGESIWISQRAAAHPKTLFINATEGGIGMHGIQNMPLKEVAERYLSMSYPIMMQISSEIQNSPMPADVTLEKIVGVVKETEASFSRCAAYTVEIEGVKVQPLEVDSKLSSEPTYQYLLKDFSEQFLISRTLEKEQLLYDPDLTSEQRMERLEALENLLYQFLGGVSAAHAIMLRVLGQQMMDFIPPAISNISQPQAELSQTTALPVGAVSDHQYYPSGELKSEQYRVEQRLEGPVTFFSKEGKVLAKGFYLNDLQEGSCLLYYGSGALYSAQNFKKGLWDGVQRYYYPTGQTKSLLPYREGKLEGQVLLYFPTGELKRELQFLGGKRHGMERIWSQQKQMILEAEYWEDLPIGRTRSWHPNGTLAIENLYDDQGKLISEQRWGADGQLLEVQSKQAGYFELLVKKTQSLTTSLEGVFNQLNTLSLLLPHSDQDAQWKQELAVIEESFKTLEQAGMEIAQQAKSRGEAVDEPLWHTPSNQRNVQQKLHELSEKLQGDLEQIQTIVSKMREGRAQGS